MELVEDRCQRIVPDELIGIPTRCGRPTLHWDGGERPEQRRQAVCVSVVQQHIQHDVEGIPEHQQYQKVYQLFQPFFGIHGSAEHKDAGGQHINKTSSAIRITHIPTNIVVTCQSERSQIQNRETAMKMLKSNLLDLKDNENKDTIDDLKGVQMDIAWGSQIRSYVFCPYTLVKDHRTNYEVGNVQAVMDVDLNGFLDSYLKYNASSNS